MSETFTKELIGLDEANEVLNDLIAQDAQAAGKNGEGQADTTNEQQAGDGGAQGSDKSDEAGKAGEEQKAAEEAKTDKPRDEQGKFTKAEQDAKDAEAKAKAAEGKGEEKGTGSRYEKARARLTGSWDELNATKATLTAERETWTKQRDAERQALEQERAEFESERDQAEQQFTPEEYDKAAAKFEREGKFDLADAAKSKADQLRKNPPQKRADRLAGQRKEWALKAATEFPDVAKENSPLQVRVAQILKTEPDLEKHPKGLYLASRIAQLEAASAAGNASQQKLAESDKALKTAQARIKELEQLSAPGDGQANNRLPGRKTFAQMSDTEQFQQLEREAQEMGSLVR